MPGATPAEAADQAVAAGAAAAPETATHVQKFSVSYEFPVVFTSGLFTAENPVLIGAVLDAVGLVAATRHPPHPGADAG